MTFGGSIRGGLGAGGALRSHDHSSAIQGGTFDAANLTSGAATVGQVFTADGNGGAAFQDTATGGGGASFAFDGATFTPGEYVEWSGSRDITVELTKGGASIASGYVFADIALFSSLDFTDDDSVNTNNTFSLPLAASRVWTNEKQCYLNPKKVFVEAASGTTSIIVTVNGTYEDIDVYLAVTLPSGAFVVSGIITVPSIPQGP